jgi:hypothetical protein
VKAARRTLLAAQAAPDGCTLVMGCVATHGVNMAVHRNPGCDTARDVVTLGVTFTAANILVVNPERQAAIRTAQAFVGVCRAKPRDLSDGSAGVGSPARPNCGPSSQIESGMVQATSWTLMEEGRWDSRVLVSDDDAASPIIDVARVPAIESVLLDEPDRPSLGVGEGSRGPTGAAIANAIRDATGRRVADVPFTPERVRAVLRG